MEARPPSGARRLIAWAAQWLGTPELAESADELFTEKSGCDGRSAARRWYRRQAVAALGRVLGTGLAAVRSSLRPGWLTGSLLDVKLGVRLLARYPGLTLVGGLAMAFAVFVGAGTFEFIDETLPGRSLPLPDGKRIVGLRYWNRAENGEVLPSAADLRRWRHEVRTIVDLGGFQTAERNLFVDGEVTEPVEVARISAAAFRMAGVPPLRGRGLIEADEEPGANPVVVLGYKLWQSRFHGRSDMVDRAVRLDEAHATVVGVMPEGFGFPIHHEVWVPLRLDTPPGDRRSGATLRVFGRLAPGATLEDAQAELDAATARAALDAPDRHEHLLAEVLPYREALFSRRIGFLLRAMIHQANVFTALFLILVAANVALLMFARAATREREIVVRTALGASRGRIVTQLFVEALVLSTLATVLGLAATGPGLQWLEQQLRAMGGEMPFWFDTRVSAATVQYALVLTVLGATVAGVMPALRITSRDLQSRLRTATGGGGLRLGGIWTVVVVVQIAATVVFTAGAWLIVRQASRTGSVEANFPAEQYVSMRLEIDSDSESAKAAAGSAGGGFLQRYGTYIREVKQRLAEHPAVRGVTVAERLPVLGHSRRWLELDAGGAAPVEAGRPGYRVSPVAVDSDFFEVFQAPIVSGRAFDSSDLQDGANTVVVDQRFVDQVLGGRSAVGRRIRYLDRQGRHLVAVDRLSDGGARLSGSMGRQDAGDADRWYEIVGVVRELIPGRSSSLDLEEPPDSRIYHALNPGRGGTYPLQIVVYLPAGPEAVLPTLLRSVAAVGPSLRLYDVETLDRATSSDAAFWQFWADLVRAVSAIALLLSVAGIYAVMSFTVARRTREIGLRVALGARGPQVARDIFSRPLAHVCIGVLLGCLLMGAVAWIVTEGRATLTDVPRLMAFGMAVLGVSALACVGPILRALRVEPAAALGAEE